MTGFHLDLKVAHYRADYLAELFPRLAGAGYTHIFFEIEDKVRLESLPNTEWCESYSKEEFAGILACARRDGLTPVPIIQTLGHMEWVLSHSAYHPLRESPASAYMLCPSNPEALPFLIRYMDEVGELFDNPPFIHLGADEATLLGSCPECRRRVESSSRSALFFEHMNPLFRHALSRGWRPIAWADMALAHHGAIERCDRGVIWMDWDYWTQASNTETYVNWATRKHGGTEVFPPDFFRNGPGRFARNGDGSIRPWFYTDYLLDNGFDVLLAPASRSGGDHAFAPHLRHLGNILGAANRARQAPLPMGILVTSWAVRLNHLETQWPSLHIPDISTCHPTVQWRDMRGALTLATLGVAAPAFFDAWEKICPCFTLAEGGRASETAIHYYGQYDSIPFILDDLRRKESLEKERDAVAALLPGHEEAARILDGIAAQVPQENRCLRFWRFAAKAIRARAEEQLFFLNAMEHAPDKARASEMLLRMEALRDEYRALLLDTCTPASVERELGMVFGSPWRHMMRLANREK